MPASDRLPFPLPQLYPEAVHYGPRKAQVEALFRHNRTVEIGFVVVLLGGTWILPNTIEAMVKRFLGITGPRSDQITVVIFAGIMLAALLVMLYVGVRRARRLMRTELAARGHRLCIPCGYDLTAHGDADRCPECGASGTAS